MSARRRDKVTPKAWFSGELRWSRRLPTPRLALLRLVAMSAGHSSALRPFVAFCYRFWHTEIIRSSTPRSIDADVCGRDATRTESQLLKGSFDGIAGSCAGAAKTSGATIYGNYCRCGSFGAARHRGLWRRRLKVDAKRGVTCRGPTARGSGRAGTSQYPCARRTATPQTAAAPSAPPATPAVPAAATPAVAGAVPAGVDAQVTAGSISLPSGAAPAPGQEGAAPVVTGSTSPAGNIAAVVPRQARQAIPGLSGMAIGMAGRADNYASWKPDDYRHARAENNPRLIAAVTYLGPSKASSENAAHLLVELLRAGRRGQARIDLDAPSGRGGDVGQPGACGGSGTASGSGRHTARSDSRRRRSGWSAAGRPINGRWKDQAA